MKLLKWTDLPLEFQNDEVKKYYDVLTKKKTSIFFKRLFDIVVSFLLILLFFPAFMFIAVLIKIDSPGKVIFTQARVTQYGSIFNIYKFRTMYENADLIGSQVTTNNDLRITTLGIKLRKYRIDELPQLFNILKGEMTFVGTRPEVPKFVDKYSNEMLATLLLPAGVTSMASILFKDENKLLDQSSNVEETYIKVVLPKKMRYNLDALDSFGFLKELIVMVRTLIEIIK